MRKAILLSIIAIWIASFVLLVIALTDLVPDNPLKEYSFTIGIGFITVSYLVKLVYRKFTSI